MDFALVFKFILAFAVGAVIGFEREVNEKKDAANGSKKTAILGIRTFSLASSLGAIAAIFYGNYLALSLIITAAFLILTLTFYVLDSLSNKDFGITTEVALIYSYILGLLIILEVIPIQLTLAIYVVLLFLLSRKKAIKNAIEDIKNTEFNAFVSLAIIALVILPFLPNQSFSLASIPNLSNFLNNLGLNANQFINLELINPFKIWMIVALITGVDLAGYVLEKTVGQKKGWLLASAAGGFISSTATTQTLAQESKHSQGINHLVSAAVIANLVSFIQIAILIGALNFGLLTKLIPVLVAMVLGALAITFFFLQSKEKDKQLLQNDEAPSKEIINLGSAIKFVVLFLIISTASKIALALFGNNGFLIATTLGAIVGLDAVMINTAQTAGSAVNLNLALVAFILANFVNLLAKSIYSFLQGKREFAIKFSISMGIIIIFSLLGLFFSDGF